MAKIIRVTKCAECPFKIHYWCSYESLELKTIEDHEKIPEFCPLEDYKNGGEK